MTFTAASLIGAGRPERRTVFRLGRQCWPDADLTRDSGFSANDFAVLAFRQINPALQRGDD
jgi:hypothetical protein